MKFTFRFVLIIVAIVLFTLAGLGVVTPTNSRWNLVGLGLALWALADLVNL